MSLRDKIEHAIQNQPCMVKDLKAKFGGDRAADRKVMEALDELVHDAVVCQKSGVFFTARSGRAEKALPCKVVKLGKNFAFVMLEDESGDIFIPGRFTRGAMPGDSVLVEKFAHPRVEGSDEGEILAVLEQKNDMVGTARRIEGRLKFVPDDCPAISMTIQRDCEGGAKDGDKVAVEILQQVEGNLIYPRTVGHLIGLPGMWVLLAICIGGELMGMAGMLLGVPLAAMLYRLIGKDVRRRERDGTARS